MTRAFVRSLLATIFIGATTVVPVWSEEFRFDESANGWTSEHTRFIEALSITVKKTYPFLEPRDFSTSDLRSTLADLNGDGVREIFVYPFTFFFCGDSDGCDVSIYQKQETGRVYIDNAYQVDDTIFVEDHWINGWRTLTNKKGIRADAYRYCWLRSTELYRTLENKDMLGMPYTPGMAGYFWSVRINAECPKD